MTKKGESAKMTPEQREKKHIQDAKYRAENKEKIKVGKAKHYSENKEAYHEKYMAKKDWYADRYQNNKEHHQKLHAAWRNANPERSKELIARWEADNPERNRENKRNRQQRRDVRKAGGIVEIFKDVEIFERDGWVCGLCGDPIDPLLRRRKGDGTDEMMSVSLDHIIPIDAGGDHTRANVQASHLGCNVRKSNRVILNGV